MRDRRHIRAIGAGALLSRNLLVYGLGGIIVPSSASRRST